MNNKTSGFLSNIRDKFISPGKSISVKKNKIPVLVDVVQDNTGDYIKKLHSIIAKKQKIIDQLEWESYKSPRINNMIVAMSFSVWSILSWLWVGLYSQISPDSSLSSFMSLTSKQISDMKTWYELFHEQAWEITKKSEELKIYKERNWYLEKMTKLQEELRTNYAFIIQSYQEKELSATNNWKSPVIQPEKQEVANNDTVYNTVWKIGNDVVTDFKDTDLKFQIIKTSDWHVNVWIEYKWKKSIGFYAELPRFKDIITKTWMKLRIQDRIHQLNIIEQIKSIWEVIWIGISEKSVISLKVHQLYNGNNEVIIYDAFTKKTSKFIVEVKKYSQNETNQKIDEILSSFMN